MYGYGIDDIPLKYWQYNVGEYGKFNLSNNLRINDKLLVEAQDRTSDYMIKYNRLGWTFESLMRSVGLAGGTIFGGIIGGATLGAIGGGVGRGIGEFLGNRIYGQSLKDLDEIVEDYKWRQMSNNIAMEMAGSSQKILDEVYNQVYQEENQMIEGIGQ